MKELPRHFGDAAPPLIRVRDLRVEYRARRGLFRRSKPPLVAVDRVSFDLHAGESLGLVGESGCGKSTLAHTVLRLLTPAAGEVMFDGSDVFGLSRSELGVYRRGVQIVFQDPYTSLNPRMSAKEIVGEGLRIHRICRGREWHRRVDALLEQVGLSPSHGGRRPDAFSGGQRQRLGIARALALNPRVIVCDEPVSALDVSVQAQILNLLKDLQERFGLSYLFISHDLSVIRQMSDRVAVMYLGRFVELGKADEVLSAPSHPYTHALMNAVPRPDPSRRRDRWMVRGEVPDPTRAPSGCHFHPRCVFRREECDREDPPWRSIETSAIDGRDGFRCVLEEGLTERMIEEGRRRAKAENSLT